VAGTAGLTLIFGGDAVVLVGGIPGAGKTTLLERAVRPGEARVLDSADVRRALRARFGRRVPYALYRPAVHALHLARVWRALPENGPLVIHDCATRGPLRRMLLRRARRAGRPVFLILLHVDPDVARRGQADRGRTVRRRAMRRHARRWGRMVTTGPVARPAPALLAEGYAGIRVLDRPGADAIGAVRFSGAAVPLGREVGSPELGAPASAVVPVEAAASSA
jgi:predicted kinase